MDSGLYPLHRCKTIHFVRHAQGLHNLARDNHIAYTTPDFLDAQITPLGWQQVDDLRNHVHSSGLSKKFELVVVSPLLRTMQTAAGMFGGQCSNSDDGIDVLPLMLANVGDSGRPAISSKNCPPFVAMELCRERLGVNWCDKRRNISEYKPLFPAIDFSLIDSDEDVLWVDSARETNEELAARGMKFLNWLSTRKEKEIAVVTHSAFLLHTLCTFGDDCHPSVKKEICRPFDNCELRSLIIVDKSMISSNPPVTDYPGRVPPGIDAPSEEASEENI